MSEDIKPKDKLTWCGKPLEELSKEQLIAAVYHAHRQLIEQRKTSKLFRELLTTTEAKK